MDILNTFIGSDFGTQWGVTPYNPDLSPWDLKTVDKLYEPYFKIQALKANDAKKLQALNKDFKMDTKVESALQPMIGKALEDFKALQTKKSSMEGTNIPSVQLMADPEYRKVLSELSNFEQAYGNSLHGMNEALKRTAEKVGSDNELNTWTGSALRHKFVTGDRWDDLNARMNSNDPKISEAAKNEYYNNHKRDLQGLTTYSNPTQDTEEKYFKENVDPGIKNQSNTKGFWMGTQKDPSGDNNKILVGFTDNSTTHGNRENIQKYLELTPKEIWSNQRTNKMAANNWFKTATGNDLVATLTSRANQLFRGKPATSITPGEWVEKAYDELLDKISLNGMGKISNEELKQAVKGIANIDLKPISRQVPVKDSKNPNRILTDESGNPVFDTQSMFYGPIDYSTQKLYNWIVGREEEKVSPGLHASMHVTKPEGGAGGAGAAKLNKVQDIEYPLSESVSRWKDLSEIMDLGLLSPETRTIFDGAKYIPVSDEATMKAYLSKVENIQNSQVLAFDEEGKKANLKVAGQTAKFKDAVNKIIKLPAAESKKGNIWTVVQETDEKGNLKIYPNIGVNEQEVKAFADKDYEIFKDNQPGGIFSWVDDKALRDVMERNPYANAINGKNLHHFKVGDKYFRLKPVSYLDGRIEEIPDISKPNEKVSYRALVPVPWDYHSAQTAIQPHGSDISKTSDAVQQSTSYTRPNIESRLSYILGQ